VYALSDVRALPPLQTQFLATYESEAEGWRGGLQPYGPMSLLPSSQALNYGQSIFEGMKVPSCACPQPNAWRSTTASPSLRA
jgi:hypothetical protein